MLGRLLAELPVPASAQARERTVTAARDALAPPRRRPRRRPLAAGAACVLALALVSPPGQAAIERVGRARRHRRRRRGADARAADRRDRRQRPSARRHGLRVERVPGRRRRLGVLHPARLARATAPTAAVSSCSGSPDGSGARGARNYLSSYLIQRLASRRRAALRRHERASRARCGSRSRTRDADREQQLPVDFARVDGERMRRATRPRTFAVFTDVRPRSSSRGAAAGSDRFRDLG